MRKHSIRTKMLITYGIVLIAIMSSLVIAFSLVLTGYMKSRITNQLGMFKELFTEYTQRYNENYGKEFTQEIERRIYASSDMEAIMIKSDHGVTLKNINFDYDGRQEQTKALLSKTNNESFEIGVPRYVTTQYGSYIAIKFPLGESEEFRDCSIVIYSDLNQYNNVIDGSERVLKNAAIIAAVIMIGAVFILSDNISRPLKRLCHFANEIGHGNFKKHEENFSVRELSELADDMNAAALKLDKYDKEQKSFFQNVSHELRTPLMSIQGYAEGIQDGVFADNKEASGIIIEESKRLAEMLEQMMYISKIDQSEMKKEICNISDILRSVKEKLDGLTVDGKKQITLELPETDIFMNCDAEAILRALMNVISNGIRYAEKSVDVELYEKDKSILITVCDDGDGISKDEIPYIFDRFYKGKKGKHGIGLSLAKSIAEAHSGTLTAENKSDGGACFTFKFKQ